MSASRLPIATDDLIDEVMERFPCMTLPEQIQLIRLSQEYYATAKPAIRVLELFDVVCCIDGARVSYFKECDVNTEFRKFYESIVDFI
jgi:hypothetical protein